MARVNILHLLSQNHLTGAEVYAAQLIHEQTAAGHTVHQVSNDFFMETEAHRHKLEVEAKSRRQFFKNVLWLRTFLIENKIQVIHTHSRAAAKLAYWARVGVKAGLVATIHGRQHSSLSKKLWNQYGDFIVPVCEAIRRQLKRDFRFNERRLKVIPNGISENSFRFLNENSGPSSDQTIKVAIIGRTTGPKGERTRQIVNALWKLQSELNFKAEIILVGASNAAITLGLDEDVIVSQVHVGHLTSKDYVHYDLIVGSGRVAIESLLTGMPTICFGEASYLGLAREKNIHRFIESNFGDIELNSLHPVINLIQLKEDIKNIFSSEFNLQERKNIAQVIQSEFNNKKVAQAIYRVYECSYFTRNYAKWFPILMYHKVPDQPLETQHKIFVTKENFRKHLEFFKSQGFQTLTFNELKEYKSGKKDFSTFPKKPLVLTFDDGYVYNLVNASPLLKEFGFKAQIFLLADSKVDSNYWDHSPTEKSHDIVSGAQRQQWLNSAFEVGSHGFSHKRITAMDDHEALHELTESKKSLEAEFGREVCVYAFTYGDTNKHYAQLAFEAGYDYAVNTDTGGLKLEENPYQIFRVNIFPNETAATLKKKTSTWYRRYYYWKRKK